jgi:hypothetical protein
MGMAHWEENIAPVHEDHNDAPSSCEIGEIARYHKNYGDNVVRHHLPMIFSTSLSIEDKNLVGVKGSLRQVV